MSLGEIVKKTILNLSKSGKSATPDLYKKEFCLEASRQGIHIEECEKGLSRFINRLSPKIQKDIYKKNIKTTDEFITFLIAEFNRMKLKENKDFLDELMLLTKYILKSISLLHNKEAFSLAQNSFNRLANATSNDITVLREKWKFFSENYDNNFLNRLNIIAEVDKSNLKKTLLETINKIEKLQADCQKDKILQDYRNLSSLIITSTVPSITSELNNSIINLDKKLKQTPELIVSSATQEEIKIVINRRKELDRTEFINANKKAQDVLMNLLQLSNENNFKQRILDVKDIIKETNNDNFDIKKMEMLGLVASLERGMEQFNNIIETKQEDIDLLENKVKELEGKLIKLENEKDKFQNDFVNKAFEIGGVGALEKRYKEHLKPYTIAIIRIDNYSNIVNSYSKKTWDAIFQTFRRIINKDIKDGDIINAMDVRTLLLFLNGEELSDGLKFCEHIKEAITHSKFVYKDKQITATVSMGVASRDEDSDFELAMKKAMDRLNIAKKRQNIIVSKYNIASLLNI